MPGALSARSASLKTKITVKRALIKRGSVLEFHSWVTGVPAPPRPHHPGAAPREVRRLGGPGALRSDHPLLFRELHTFEFLASDFPRPHLRCPDAPSIGKAAPNAVPAPRCPPRHRGLAGFSKANAFPPFPPETQGHRLGDALVTLVKLPSVAFPDSSSTRRGTRFPIDGRDAPSSAGAH